MPKYSVLAAVAMLGLALPATSGAQAPAPAPWQISQTVNQLPDGPLYWLLQTFPTRQAAEAAAGSSGQVGEAEGQVWLFTVGRQGEEPPGGTLVDEIGPLEVPSAARYALNISYIIQVPGAAASTGASVVHTHPGTESWYMLAGVQTTWYPGIRMQTEAGQSWVGEPGGTPVLLVNTGRGENRKFALFVLDADQPGISPALFP